MAEGGYERLPQGDPEWEGNDDDDNADQTGAFSPNGPCKQKKTVRD